MPSDRPPERYEPGELNRTRRNLGSVGEDEARRLREKLGGEVGVEKAPPEVLIRYDQMKTQTYARSKGGAGGGRSRSGGAAGEGEFHRPSTPEELGAPSEPPIGGEPGAASAEEEGPGGPRAGRTRIVLPKVEPMPWRERWVTDRYCARHEIGVKTRWQAWRSLLGVFGSPGPDLINRHFVLDVDHHFARSLENLVLAVRALTAKRHKNALQSLRRFPAYNEALRVLREWDLESLHRELVLLQADPGHTTPKTWAPLLRIVCRPWIQLSALTVNQHLLPALHRIYELDKQYLHNQAERDRLLSFYAVAREELPHLWDRLRSKVHPLLLKLLSPKFLLPQEFLDQCRPVLLEFLGLKESDVIQDQGPSRPVVLNPGADGESAESTAARAEPPEEETRPRTRPLVSKALDLLEAMYPQSGWRQIEARPDFFAYFQPLLDYPRMAELVSVYDPLQALMTLAQILAQLMAGFQNIQWGKRPGLDEPLGPRFEKALSQWHFFWEEVCAKNYLGWLNDLVRYRERNAHLSPEARRLEGQMLFIKKKYLLPHLDIPVVEELRVKGFSYPSLLDQVQTWIEDLSGVALEIEEAVRKARQAGLARGEVRCESVLNPLGAMRFQLESPSSQRLASVYRKLVREGEGDGPRDGRNNRNLIGAVLSIFELMEQWLSRPDSPLYQGRPPYLYRTDGPEDTPVYKVTRKNTVAFLKKVSEREVSDPAYALEEPSQDLVYRHYHAREEFRLCLARAGQDDHPFCLSVIRGHGVGAGRTPRDWLEEHKPVEAVPWTSEDAYVWWLWPGMYRDPVMKRLKALLEQAAEDRQALAAFVVPYTHGLDEDKMLNIPHRGFMQVTEYPAQVLGLYRVEKGLFEFRDDLPVVD